MRELESAWAAGITRRKAFRALMGFVAGSPLLRSQQDPFRDHSRIPSLDEMLTAFDFETVAYSKIPRQVYDYMAHGDGSEFTLRRNREAYDWAQLVPRGIAYGTSVSTETELFGLKMAMPIMVAPSSGQGQLHPDGEMGMHVATTAAKTRMIISNVATFPVDKIAAAATGPIWFQLYPRPGTDANRAVLENAQKAGCNGVVVTIDIQASVYERDLHDRNLGPGGARGNGGRGGANSGRGALGGNPYRVAENRMWYEWKLFDEIRPVIKGPMLAKGILTPEDARLCVEHGCDGVYVSNHGGRSMDYGPSTLEVLPAIVDAVAGRVPVIFDSGIRRGTDVLKALALGAKAVCLGRAARWGLAAYGAPGAQRVLEILQAELVQAMAYTGHTSVESINRRIVRTDFP
jgi:isopentenyl diphosphate isomerase/L-lactate dehydrogenase-like FMN-dependent dehydrogenase